MYLNQDLSYVRKGSGYSVWTQLIRVNLLLVIHWGFISTRYTYFIKFVSIS